jgi:hypothetical protein
MPALRRPQGAMRLGAPLAEVVHEVPDACRPVAAGPLKRSTLRQTRATTPETARADLLI